MTFNNYLNTDSENYESITEFFINYLTEFSSKDFPYEQQIQLKGIAGKFIDTIDSISYVSSDKKKSFSDKINSFNDELRYYKRYQNFSIIKKLLFPLKHKNINGVQDSFENIFSASLEFINEANKTKSSRDNHIKLNGFYKPENSNKKQISKLIKEAIELIEEDKSLTEKSKKELINYLNKVLKNLEREHTNWSGIIGKIKETIIVLGALGSFAGGISPLFQAKEKLEESTTVIEKTSVNLNYTVINETFNYQEIKQISNGNNVILQLEENIIIDEQEK